MTAVALVNDTALSKENSPATVLGKRKAEEEADALCDPEERRYRGVRKRTWGVWVTEVREPASRKKVWLGSYATAEEAARVYDFGMLLLRRVPAWRLNFPPPQQRPVIVKTVVATALLEAAQLGYAARQKEVANGKGKLEPGKPVRIEGKFESDLVQMDVIGDNVRMVDYWPSASDKAACAEKTTAGTPPCEPAVRSRDASTPASPSSAITEGRESAEACGTSDAATGALASRDALGMVPTTPASRNRSPDTPAGSFSCSEGPSGVSMGVQQPPAGVFLFGAYHAVASPSVAFSSPPSEAPVSRDATLMSSASGKFRPSSPPALLALRH